LIIINKMLQATSQLFRTVLGVQEWVSRARGTPPSPGALEGQRRALLDQFEALAVLDLSGESLDGVLGMRLLARLRDSYQLFLGRGNFSPLSLKFHIATVTQLLTSPAPCDQTFKSLVKAVKLFSLFCLDGISCDFEGEPLEAPLPIKTINYQDDQRYVVE
jgi:hypothetical protein